MPVNAETEIAQCPAVNDAQPIGAAAVHAYLGKRAVTALEPVASGVARRTDAVVQNRLRVAYPLKILLIKACCLLPRIGVPPVCDLKKTLLVVYQRLVWILNDESTGGPVYSERTCVCMPKVCACLAAQRYQVGRSSAWWGATLRSTDDSVVPCCAV
eukprot:CAMPEP_0119344750 /NCGR_PEP_ID=MMETSP1333-20130426/107131_1 /TAXON_ID=418940 /ORGANISM="Scyphosphaera apsteinii, Strain RCC1455" /LENGTH=156 /DNA_ID=CAMNT_0007357197 /DNA_START=1399 /DNA_END=1869 /DNA_ORIENTATION=+